MIFSPGILAFSKASAVARWCGSSSSRFSSSAATSCPDWPRAWARQSASSKRLRATSSTRSSAPSKRPPSLPRPNRPCRILRPRHRRLRPWPSPAARRDRRRSGIAQPVWWRSASRGCARFRSGGRAGVRTATARGKTADSACAAFALRALERSLGGGSRARFPAPCKRPIQPTRKCPYHCRSRANSICTRSHRAIWVSCSRLFGGVPETWDRRGPHRPRQGHRHAARDRACAIASLAPGGGLPPRRRTHRRLGRHARDAEAVAQDWRTIDGQSRGRSGRKHAPCSGPDDSYL